MAPALPAQSRHAVGMAACMVVVAHNNTRWLRPSMLALMAPWRGGQHTRAAFLLNSRGRRQSGLRPGPPNPGVLNSKPRRGHGTGSQAGAVKEQLASLRAEQLAHICGKRQAASGKRQIDRRAHKKTRFSFSRCESSPGPSPGPPHLMKLSEQNVFSAPDRCLEIISRNEVNACRAVPGLVLGCSTRV